MHRERLGREPWLVLAGRRHRLAGRGSITLGDLAGERIVVTGDRDGRGYDGLVTDALESMGVTAALERGGPGPALFGPVAAGGVRKGLPDGLGRLKKIAEGKRVED